jgi:hypothetical protein
MRRTKAGRAYGFAAFCFTTAAIFAVLGAIQLEHIHALKLRGEVVLGQVVASDHFHCNGGRGGCTHPHRDWIDVEYETLAGQKLRQQTTGAIREDAAVGGWIELRYDRDHPRHVQDAYADLSYTIPVAVPGSIAALFLLFTALLLRKRHRAP